MQVTRSEEYGVRLVIRLAADGGQLTIRELARHERLPEPTVAKVIGRLRRAGVVSAERGRNGGYALARAAEETTLQQVLEAFDARLYDGGFCSRMSADHAPCAHDADCGLRPVWRGLTNVIGDFLAGITVADLAAGGSPIRGRERLPVLRAV